MLTEWFKREYLQSLEKFALFYDDFFEYGDRDADLAFYFIPGIDGVPGQIRFALPMLRRAFGKEIYVRCLHLDELSATRPIWEKFTVENVEKKHDQIVRDLEALAHDFDQIRVVVSSNGFYDFLWAFKDLPAAVKQKAQLIWVAVAPDFFRPSPWEAVFFRLNGFVHNGQRWFAVPNHNLLRWINPETTTSHTWKRSGEKKIFYKNDLESRLSLFGLQWSFNSLEAFNACLSHAISRADVPIDIQSYVLVATNDGYWQGRPLSDIDALVDRYLSNKQILHRHSSHLWVLVPDNMAALLALVRAATPRRQTVRKSASSTRR